MSPHFNSLDRACFVLFAGGTENSLTVAILSEPLEVLVPEDSQGTQTSSGQRSQTGAGTEARILVVEDDSAVRSAVCRVLKRRGYDVIEFQNGEQAITTLAEAPQSVDLVISDIVMPEMSGLELRDRLREIQPTVPVLLMTGYSQAAITRLGNRESLGPLIEKPFTMDGLLEHVRSMLDG